MSPIHPSLALLAGAAKQRNWAGLQKQLGLALRKPAWLRPEHRVGDPTGYMRHLLYIDPHGDFVMTAITWLPGQVSARHGHQVWCAFGVAEGELTEEQFDAKLLVSKSSVLRPGDIADRDLEGTIIHQVANRGTAPLVSLHLYGVSADRLTTGINRYF
ncbi:MAG TPA: cysteine dioxygenase family protein [Burkholderiales bacterium]|jgi:predicted metal-dependent enzyme (double-stranded beta helix superfamily)|nr:cysteine dioxygenase family protein [Burkholderiales bacterium]